MTSALETVVAQIEADGAQWCPIVPDGASRFENLKFAASGHAVYRNATGVIPRTVGGSTMKRSRAT